MNLSGKEREYKFRFGARAKKRTIEQSAFAKASMAEITDEQVVLLEKSVQANRDALEENRKLREEIKAREDEHQKVLSDVLKELRELKDSRQRTPERRSRAKSKKIQVPPGCRVSSVGFTYLYV